MWNFLSQTFSLVPLCAKKRQASKIGAKITYVSECGVGTTSTNNAIKLPELLCSYDFCLKIELDDEHKYVDMLRSQVLKSTQNRSSFNQIFSFSFICMSLIKRYLSLTQCTCVYYFVYICVGYVLYGSVTVPVRMARYLYLCCSSACVILLGMCHICLIAK